MATTAPSASTMTAVLHMRRALELAMPMLGRTAPNPAVGCVIVRNGEVVGEGATEFGGTPHAEENALKMAGPKARGAVVFVTLEPCGERSSGASSCAEKLVDAGVQAVIFACHDPSPKASGRGLTYLKAAGIATAQGPLRRSCNVLIEASKHFYKTGFPLVRESESAIGFDNQFIPLNGYTLQDSLAFMASKGFRRLYVQPHSDVALLLKSEGLLAA